jgi:predicted transcriptional regulator
VLPLINEVEKFKILEIQKLRYNILKLTYDMSNQKKSIVNLFKIGEPLGIEKEKLERIYFYLEDEGLVDFYALGGCFFITDKGKELIEKRNSNRIF